MHNNSNEVPNKPSIVKASSKASAIGFKSDYRQCLISSIGTALSKHN